MPRNDAVALPSLDALQRHIEEFQRAGDGLIYHVVEGFRPCVDAGAGGMMIAPLRVACAISSIWPACASVLGQFVLADE